VSRTIASATIADARCRVLRVRLAEWGSSMCGADGHALQRKELVARTSGGQRILSDASSPTDLMRNHAMTPRYEYKFVRIGEGKLSVKKIGRESYQDAVRTHAAEGWRLVQIFAPGTGAYGVAKYYELVLERPLADS
jgi:hypothetical protein